MFLKIYKSNVSINLMDLVTAIGLMAAILTTGAALPQTVKVIKTKSTKDLSLTMYSMVVIGVTLWILYGIMINNLVIIFANSIGFFFAATILAFKIKYK